MIEDSFAKLIRVPGNSWVIRVVIVTATKDLISVARWIEEVDCLAMGEPVPSGSNIDWRIGH